MAVNCLRRRAMRAAASSSNAQVKVKGQPEAVTEEYYVYGWKVLVLIEVQTRLPWHEGGQIQSMREWLISAGASPTQPGGAGAH